MKIQVNKNASVMNALLCGVPVSAKALGYYSVLCEADEETNYSGIKEYLGKYLGEGVCSISSGMKELISKGFVEKKVARTSLGAFSGTKYIVTLPTVMLENKKQ